jgi:hypothetical protein
MTSLKTKIAAGTVTVALLSTAFAPATFAANTVRGNGADSVNKIKTVNKKKTQVSQVNETLVVNGVLVAQNTGKNKANKNTGAGDKTVSSGDATATVTNTTTTGGNMAEVNGCGCPDDDGDNTIRGNGADSYNKITVVSKNKTEVSQTNSTAVVNLVGVLQNTGGNSASKNTGGGDVDATSGDADATVTNEVTTGGNHLTVN